MSKNYWARKFIWEGSDAFDPDDRILLAAHNNRLPSDEYGVRFPPKSEVTPLLLKCPACKDRIDISFEWVDAHAPQNETIFDFDCPHCWSVICFKDSTSIRKILAFRKRCKKWIEPEGRKVGRVGPALRFKVLERDGFRCQYCGASPDNTSLHIDHVLPIAAGGTNELENLKTACAACNLGKGKEVMEA
jgi:5-methylcytosine-specific restriction endonuclease McrA